MPSGNKPLPEPTAQATSRYLSQCWPRSVSPYGVTRPQWVKPLQTYFRDKFVQEKASKNVVCKISSIFFRPQSCLQWGHHEHSHLLIFSYVKMSSYSQDYSHIADNNFSTFFSVRICLTLSTWRGWSSTMWETWLNCTTSLQCKTSSGKECFIPTVRMKSLCALTH